MGWADEVILWKTTTFDDVISKFILNSEILKSWDMLHPFYI